MNSAPEQRTLILLYVESNILLPLVNSRPNCDKEYRKIMGEFFEIDSNKNLKSIQNGYNIDPDYPNSGYGDLKICGLVHYRNYIHETTWIEFTPVISVEYRAIYNVHKRFKKIERRLDDLRLKRGIHTGYADYVSRICEICKIKQIAYIYKDKTEIGIFGVTEFIKFLSDKIKNFNVEKI